MTINFSLFMHTMISDFLKKIRYNFNMLEKLAIQIDKSNHFVSLEDHLDLDIAREHDGWSKLKMKYLMEELNVGTELERNVKYMYAQVINSFIYYLFIYFNFRN